MKARLRDGTVVELVKDCGCMDSIHQGPHWLHMDAFDRAHSRALLPPGGLDAPVLTLTALRAFVASEVIRLGEKRYQMESHGIEELIVDTPPAPT